MLSQYIYQKGFEENQFGYASAISIVLFAICFLVTIVQYAVNKRRSDDDHARPLAVDHPVRVRARKPRRTPISGGHARTCPGRRGGGVLLPFYWMVVSSLKTNNEVFTIPVTWWPRRRSGSNYVDIWQKSDMTTWLRQHR